MPVVLLVVVYSVVHALAIYLTRASGVYIDLFGRDWTRLHAGDGSEVLAAASGEWIDNHAFWDLSEAPRRPDRFWDDEHDEHDEHDDAELPPLRVVNS